MECPRCKERLKRLRTVDKGNSVTRHNICEGCGYRVKTIELYLGDLQQERIDTVQRTVKAEREAMQLTLQLDSIRTVFQSLHSAIVPLQEAEERAEPVSSLPGRYTKRFRSR